MPGDYIKIGGGFVWLLCLIRFRLPVSEIEIEDDSIKQSYEGECLSNESVSDICFWKDVIIMLPTFGVIFLQYLQLMFNQCQCKYSSINHGS